MVKIPKLAFCMVVESDGMCGLFAGPVEQAWAAAADLSAERHIRIESKPFHTILACAPKMYDELWTAGKCMYKLEPVLADGGELIIYAPHIRDVCIAHGETIESVGYHCRDYFLNTVGSIQGQAVECALAHCVHVKGLGTFENGVETPRAEVTLATQISEAKCRQINLGYRDPAGINPDDYAQPRRRRHPARPPRRRAPLPPGQLTRMGVAAWPIISAAYQIAATHYNFSRSPSPQPSPAGEGAWPSAAASWSAVLCTALGRSRKAAGTAALQDAPAPFPSRLAKRVDFDSFSLREKVAAGRMRVKRHPVHSSLHPCF